MTLLPFGLGAPTTSVPGGCAVVMAGGKTPRPGPAWRQARVQCETRVQCFGIGCETVQPRASRWASVLGFSGHALFLRPRIQNPAATRLPRLPRKTRLLLLNTRDNRVIFAECPPSCCKLCPHGLGLGSPAALPLMRARRPGAGAGASVTPLPRGPARRARPWSRGRASSPRR